jgi:hypothetical protein
MGGPSNIALSLTALALTDVLLNLNPNSINRYRFREEGSL